MDLDRAAASPCCGTTSDIRHLTRPRPGGITPAINRRVVIAIFELLVLAGVSAGLFCVCSELYTRHNTFPISYHPDEGSKVTQLLRDERNFNHPQLMLEVAMRLMERENTPRQYQAVAETGRRGSAYMAAAGAVLLAWAGYFAAGPIGFLLIAAGAGLCPPILCHAHYFKEDASLCFGMAAVICVGAAMIWRWHWAIMLPLAFALGGACGLAASGKYVGAAMIVPALILSLAVTWRRWWIMPLCPLLVIAGAYWSWTGINQRAVQNWGAFRYGFEREKLHGIEGHDNVMVPRPNAYLARLAWTDAMPHVKALCIATPLALLLARRRRKIRGADSSVASGRAPLWRRVLLGPIVVPRRSAWHVGWLALCLACYAVLLANNTIPFFRYALPLTLILYTLAALGAAWVAKAVDTRYTPAWLIGPALLAVIATFQWERCEDYLAQFAGDSHDKLLHWVNALPRGTRIVADYYTELDDGWRGRIRNRLDIDRRRYAASAGTIDSLIRRRIQYVVIAGSSYERYLDPATTFVESPAEFERRRRFYRTLFEQYPIVKQWTAEHPMQAFTNPEIYVFKLPEPQRRSR